MPTTIKLQKVNNKTGLTLEVFQHSDHIDVVQPNTDHSVVNDITLKKCTTAEDYQEHENEFNNPFFCVRDKNNIYHRWMRVFDPDGNENKVDIIHCDRNTYAQKFNVIDGTTRDGRESGLYLEVDWKNDGPNAGRVLWIVGEIVTDIVGGG